MYQYFVVIFYIKMQITLINCAVLKQSKDRKAYFRIFLKIRLTGRKFPLFYKTHA